MYNYSNYRTARSTEQSVEVIDLLVTQPSQQTFIERMQNLHLTAELDTKVIDASAADIKRLNVTLKLSISEEKELATEVLLLRHKFTELVWKTRPFNQAALTVIQNIYLFRNRKIFFDPNGPLYEQERREALDIFSSQKENLSLPLSKTFQHLIIARVWNRIISQCEPEDYTSDKFIELQTIVEHLNTIRNIYVLLTTGLVKKIVSQLGDIYKEGLSDEDACQIGSFGVARAAYRYHHSCGIRFSTYAANWIRKEVQRQSLNGRLIRISTHTIEQYSLAQKRDDTDQVTLYSEIIKRSSCIQEDTSDLGDWDVQSQPQTPSEQEAHIEDKELSHNIQALVNESLAPKESDIIKRRFGLPPYEGEPQSIISMSKIYGVTRSSIYQLESKALSTLKKALKASLVYN
ncbi:MAG: hypothetical protein COA36_01380 [Desulfotalea sp.]|nr:MAG: hypothetical protein COA36_01380 [Desulfotalea sp.]